MIFVRFRASVHRSARHRSSSPHGNVRLSLLCAALFAAVACCASLAFADEPYARSRDYDLQHSKIVLRFDVPQKQVIGEVTHTLSILSS